MRVSTLVETAGASEEHSKTWVCHRAVESWTRRQAVTRAHSWVQLDTSGNLGVMRKSGILIPNVFLIEFIF